MDNIIQKGKYIINLQDLVAQGVKGTIFKCKHRDREEQLCAKVISKTPNYVNWENENKVLERLKKSEEKHINVLRIYDINDDDQNVFVFTEQCDMNLQQLFDQQKSGQWFTIDQICDYIGQIVRGYQFLRSLKIILRDLSPKSILVKKLSNDRILLKIADFGVSRITEDGYADSRTGIPLFAAPEVYLKSSNSQRYNDSCDIYSLGIILYIMCYKGQKPYKINNFEDLQQFHEKLKKDGFQCPYNPDCPQDIRNLIEKMIIHNPEARLSWDQLDRNFTQKFLILQEDYFIDISKPIHQGAQEMFNAFNLKNHEQLVCKTIPNKQQGSSREIEIFEQIIGKYHENVIKIFQIIKQAEYTYLIFEKCDMNLYNYMIQRNQNGKQLQTKEIIQLLYQIIEGYCFLKKFGIIHKDLRPDNILLKMNQNNEYTIKIIDFGIGKIVGKEFSKAEAGIPFFSAPEVFQQGKPYDQQGDIFSLGVILYYLVFNRMFIDIKNRIDLIEFHKTLENKPFVCPNYENTIITELINNMLVYDPQKRITWEQLQNQKIFEIVKQKQPKQIQIKTVQDQFLYTKMPQEQETPNLQIPPQNGNQEIYQYIAAVQTFAFKVFTLCEDFQIQNKIFYDEILLSKQFILRFCILCLMSIQKLQKSNFILLEGVEYKIKSNTNFQNWQKEFNLNDMKKQYQENFTNLKTAQTINQTEIINYGNNLLVELSNYIQNNQNSNFLDSHIYFNKFYQKFRYAFLKSDIHIKFRFFVERFSNIFNEFPIKNYQTFQEQKINQKIFISEQMQNYVSSQLQKI